ncbi:TDP-fucosamine acetyltransferase [Roseivivax jejudonensis]|uniref:TDP-fucosamine acetyltransferase n=1 Tax=Roseivivax jejudonensis TaxID=1529041 RepID=A0A1X7A239_9RHOB|nr:GNAT family N-acetyltransferase [Roseivivax jejudonensis]SLN67939.1 TDP-fucosamine acetyltransferase [Roseivivax jejudonensis]
MAHALRPFTAADADWLIDAHRVLYAREAGFDDSFGALVATIVEAFLSDHDPARERGWIAWNDDARVGSIFCVDAGGSAAKLRLFLLLPEARGQGLGRDMLATCMAWARARGYARMTLATHESHRAACALYARTGFVCRSTRPVTNFGQALVEQHWEIAL